MRNRYNKDFEDYARKNALKLTKEQLRQKLEKKFDIIITKNDLQQYLYRHKIKCIDYNSNKVRNVSKKPIGYEYVKPDGMVLVKVANPDRWEYKQRLIYEKYHKCKLTSNDYIIFLNQDRTDFSIDNLKKVTKKESSYLSNQKMFSKNKKITELGILTAKLMIKIKNLESEGE